MHETIRLTEGERRPPGPAPCVYVIIRVIGCRIHWRTLADGWQPDLSCWAVHWMSNEREAAYRQAQETRGLLLKYTISEWNEAMNAWRAREAEAEAADERRHG